MSRDVRRNRAQGFSTRAIHLGYDPADHDGALTPPIDMTSTYAGSVSLIKTSCASLFPFFI